MPVLFNAQYANTATLWTPNYGLYIEGTEQADTLWGSQYSDSIYGLGGNDTLYGQDGDDLMDGGAGIDSLLGGRGNDALYGGLGNDFLVGGAGADALNGGDGSDTANYQTSTAAVSVNLAANTATGGDAQGDTFVSVEKLVGSSYDDLLTGTAGGCVLEGGAGHDKLYGGAGVDGLYGGSGNDRLVGGGGIDFLTGGAGADVFELARKTGYYFQASPDIIADFESGIDKISFGVRSADITLYSGNNLTEALQNGGASSRHSRGEEIKLFYDTDDNQLYQMEGSGHQYRTLHIATFATDVELHLSDFGYW